MIRIEGLNKRFGRSSVLNDIDLDIDAGERVALLGSNGAGKTTLIRCLLGEYSYDGKIAINGTDVRGNRTELLGLVGFVPQQAPPLRMTVDQLLGYAGGLSGSHPDAMKEVIEALFLDYGSIARKPFHKLSGGQKQKVLIGIALGRNYAMLVLDEPTANLDPLARQVFFSLLAERTGNSAMLLSSHRLIEVASLVNRVVELDCGKVTLDDRIADASSMDTELCCVIALNRADPSFADAIQKWGFLSTSSDLSWQGRVAGPDRLRFVGMLSRYLPLLKSVQLDELESDNEALSTVRSA